MFRKKSRNFLLGVLLGCSPFQMHGTEVDPPKQLVCSAINGLCNRLRNLASSAVIAEHTGRKLAVCWLNEKHVADCNTLGYANWTDLFVEPKLRLLSALPDEGIVFEGYPEFSSPRLVSRRAQLIPSHSDLYVTGGGQSHSPGAEYQVDIDIPDKTVIIHTIHNFKPYDMSDEAFYEEKRNFYKKLVPVPYIAKTVERIASKFPQDIVGVHVRTTDLMQQAHKKTSPAVWKYMDYMQEEIKKNPNVAFFVSSDFLPVLKHIFKVFRGRIFYNDKVVYDSKGRVERHSKEATQNALIDLLLLSKTKRLIGTRFSSFSYEAACIGGIPIVNEVLH